MNTRTQKRARLVAYVVLAALSADRLSSGLGTFALVCALAVIVISVLGFVTTLSGHYPWWPQRKRSA